MLICVHVCVTLFASLCVCDAVFVCMCMCLCVCVQVLWLLP